MVHMEGAMSREHPFILELSESFIDHLAILEARAISNHYILVGIVHWAVALEPFEVVSFPILFMHCFLISSIKFIKLFSEHRPMKLNGIGVLWLDTNGGIHRVILNQIVLVVVGAKLGLRQMIFFNLGLLIWFCLRF